MCKWGLEFFFQFHFYSFCHSVAFGEEIGAEMFYFSICNWKLLTILNPQIKNKTDVKAFW